MDNKPDIYFTQRLPSILNAQVMELKKLTGFSKTALVVMAAGALVEANREIYPQFDAICKALEAGE